MAESRRLNQGRNAIRDFLISDTAEMAVGDSDTAVNESQTALGNEVRREATDSSVEDIGTARHVIRLDLGEANGETLREVGLVDGDGNFVTRHRFSELEKTSSLEVEVHVVEKVRNVTT